MSISHTVAGYTSDGPSATLDLSLNITNTGTVPLFQAGIAIAPVGPLADRLLPLDPEPASVVLGTLPASGNVSVAYTLQTLPLLPTEMIQSLPLYFEIAYTDEAGQTQRILAESRPASPSP